MKQMHNSAHNGGGFACSCAGDDEILSLGSLCSAQLCFIEGTKRHAAKILRLKLTEDIEGLLALYFFQSNLVFFCPFFQCINKGDYLCGLTGICFYFQVV